jgi:hypothetical protein
LTQFLILVDKTLFEFHLTHLGWAYSHRDLLRLAPPPPSSCCCWCCSVPLDDDDDDDDDEEEEEDTN